MGNQVATGDLPQFRSKLNESLAEAKRLAIQRGRPLTQDEISGVVEGLAAGATGRLESAKRLDLAEKSLNDANTRFESQMAENQRQFDNGTLTRLELDNRNRELQMWMQERTEEYNNKVLDLQQKYADQGLAMDMDLMDTAKTNTQIGTVIGMADLFSSMFDSDDESYWDELAGAAAGWLMA